MASLARPAPPPQAAGAFVAMDCAALLHTPSSSAALLLFPSPYATLLPSARRLRLRLSSAFHPDFSGRRLRPPQTAMHARAKRGFSFKDAEVASPADLRFESPLTIVEYPDPVLRAKNKVIDAFDDGLMKLVDEMFDIMYKTDGIGLSAPQVGYNVQLMVFNPAGICGEGEEIVLINPRIKKYSKKSVCFNEGCLSFPGIYANVQRPESVKIDARDLTGSRFAVNFSALPARVFQHEFDHLQGILFFDRMSEEVLDGIRADLQALEKKYEEKTGLASPERIKPRKRLEVPNGFGIHEYR